MVGGASADRLRGRNLKQVTAQLRYDDLEAGLSFADTFVFEQAGGRGHFEFDYVDATRDRYELRVTHLFENGLEQEGDWSVFRDHADPEQFWVLPGPVALARRPQDDRAAFSFIKYKLSVAGTVAEGGGFVMFETTLKHWAAADARRISSLSAEIGRFGRLRPEVAEICDWHAARLAEFVGQYRAVALLDARHRRGSAWPEAPKATWHPPKRA